ARGRLLHGPLRTARLIAVDDEDRPFAGRSLRVPDRVVGHLLGDDTPDAAVQPLLRASPDVPWGEPGPLAAAITVGTTLVHLREPATGSGRALAARALREAGREVIHLDLDALATRPEAGERARLVVREARLRGAGLVARPVDALTPTLLDALTGSDTPVLIIGEHGWDPAWSEEVPLVVEVPESTAVERAALWLRELAGAGPGAGEVAATS